MNQPQYVVVERETNTLGVFGFCLMLLGYLTCGVLAVPAVFMCGFAMFREPRGLAIAGFVLSLPAVCGLILMVILFFTGILAQNLAEVRAKTRPPTVQEQIEKIQAERGQ